MSEQNKPFVITDRRKFNLDGEPRPDADPSPEKIRPVVPPAPAPEESSARVIPQPESPQPIAAAPEASASDFAEEDPNAPPAPTAEQMEQSRIAFDATAERLDIAIRSANPGMEQLPKMTFERLVQSVYMTAIMQLGGNTPEGQKPQVDLLGARQSIDMLTVIADKTTASLTLDEQQLIDSALFELRLAFLDITQALSRNAQKPQPPAPGTPGFGPSIVR
ncbi:hypothetical protein HDF16_000571 [Granulicella aggregans]|jgi:hypothetical protein|uniref:DUF1844 domain-containing protein n=1 Tax=Granulicella aggregans TaxID=474949 RepID=A0A7W7ZA02_9BACT|nr:DUF1844 domain-containing protein [Granulicella aggregans]MBB5055902.1 hypothetical protein [Granulicella aggregans]